MTDDLRSRVAQQFREFALEVLRDYDVDPELFTNDPDASNDCGVWADTALAEMENHIQSEKEEAAAAEREACAEIAANFFDRQPGGVIATIIRDRSKGDQ